MEGGIENWDGAGPWAMEWMLHRGEARGNSYQTVEQCTIVKGLREEAMVRNPIR